MECWSIGIVECWNNGKLVAAGIKINILFT